LKNVAGTELTHAVIEVLAENQWGEKSAQYYYVPQLDLGEVVGLLPHFRWQKRRLVYSPTLRVSYSIWADEGSSVNQTVELKSSEPCHDPESLRKTYHANDEQYATAGEALGVAVKNEGYLLPTPERQKRMLLDAAAPGTSYAFRLAEPGKPARSLVLKFARVRADKTTLEAEVIGMADKKPFKPDQPVWKGRVTEDQRSGYVVQFESGWSFLLLADDRQVLRLPASKAGELQQLALFGIKR
jgi:hypothetical protein